MKARKEDHEKKKIEFINKIGTQIQEQIIEDAKSELKKEQNKRKVKEAEEKRKAIMLEKLAADKKAGVIPEEDEGEWSKGVRKVEVRAPLEGAKPSGFISRGVMGTKAPEQIDGKKEEARGPPRFTKATSRPDEFKEEVMSRSGMIGTAKKDEV